MYNELMNQEIAVIVTTRGSGVLEYRGTFVAETEKTIELSNVNIVTLATNFSKGFFGENMGTFKQNLEKTIISKDCIMSCNK